MKDENEQVPLRIWVYNHWDQAVEISDGIIEVQVIGEDGFNVPLKLYNAQEVMREISTLRRKITTSDDPNIKTKSITYEELEPKIKPYEIREKLGPGETAIALWSRQDQKSQPVKAGKYQIVYLPREEDIVLGWTSAYAIDFLIEDRIRVNKEKKNQIEQIKIQDWRMRHSFQ